MTKEIFFESNWDNESIKSIFEETGVNYLPKEYLTTNQTITCPIGNILSLDKKPLYGIEIFKQPDRDFFVRGQLPKELIDLFSSKEIGESVGCDGQPYDSKIVLNRTIKTIEELKELADITKDFYRSNSIPTGQ